MGDLLLQVKIILWKVMHFRWSALAISSTIMVLGWTVVFLLPDNYQVRSTVYVDTESMLKPLLKGLAIDDTVKEQAAIMMRRTLLSRPNIEKVIIQTDLDLSVSDDREMEKLVNDLATKITISGHADKRRPDANLYKIQYTSTNPELAYKVVDALLDVFLESTLGIARQGSSSAARFMSRQISDYKTRLEDSDEAVKKFNIKHAGLLPNEKSNFYNRVYSARTELMDAELTQKELSFIVSQLTQQIKGVNKETLAATTARTDRNLSSKITEMDLQLRELKVRYTDDHPDVVAVLASIDGLRAQIAKNKSENNLNSTDEVFIENPVYQELTVLLASTQAELAVLNARVGEYQHRMTNLQSQLKTIPEIEAKYTALIRDYTTLSDTYQQLVKRKESALISEDAERSGDTVQFRVIEPPKTPLAPIGPHRPIFLLAVLGIGLGAGIGFAVLMAEIKGAIYSKQRLIDTFSAPILGVVSMTWSLEQLTKKRRDIFGLIGCLFTIAAVFIFLLVYQIMVIGLPLGNS